MKKNLPNISFIFAFVSFALTAAGQSPTLTSSNFLPQTGESFTIHGINYTSQGSAGANVTWDFSSVTSSTSGQVDCVNPSSTSYSSNFPNADIAEFSGAYGFYSYSSTDWTCEGIVSPQGVVITYSNPQKQMQFPFTYNSTFTDNFAGSFTSGVYFARSGSVTVSADGYGTLILPYGTVNNVIRIHMVETYQDDYDAGSGPETIDYSTNTYIWYKEGVHHPIFNLSVLVSTLQTVQGGFYLDQAEVGIDDIVYDASMNVYPNPAIDNVTINSEITKGVYRLHDVTGKLVLTGSINAGKFEIDLNSVGNGVYMLTLADEGGQAVRKIVKQ